MNPPGSLLFPIRIGRLSFFFRYVALLFGGVIAGLMLDVADRVAPTAKIALAVGACVILVLLLVALFRSILFPRLRDIGWHLAVSLLIFAPFVNILFLLALLFVPGKTPRDELTPLA